ncbi:MAG TPA: alpha,alpha-trehalase TreF [Sphingobacteriaceae bacterium]
MKRFTSVLFLLWVVSISAFSQSVKTPDQIYKELFVDVQMKRIFPDNKTFVDCVPKRDPEAILADYRKSRNGSTFSLKRFVEGNFQIPASPTSTYKSDTSVSVKTHINELWSLLHRKPDVAVSGSSLLPLPYSYIVPGGRFREIYYWDSYFTMLGLQESKQFDLIDDMVKNFAYLIDEYGHIPNGNRTYYLSRSQPPFFSLMVGLLAGAKGDSIYNEYLPALEKEYSYWMQANQKKLDAYSADRCVVRVDTFIVNRNWDASPTPRQESYYEDVQTAKRSKRSPPVVYLNLRSSATSGWDFCSRWFGDTENLETIKTIDIVPVDLNSLMYNLENILYTIYQSNGDSRKAAFYKQKSIARKNFIDQYCWNERDGVYYDYDFRSKRQIKVPSLAMTYPLFVKIATQQQAEAVTTKLKSEFLKPGGFTTTLINTGEQWDAPNGWAPLQWMAIRGLENYEKTSLASEAAKRWVALNIKVFHKTGKLMEKYNVVNTTLEAGGGEYPSQDGFGWTNGVLLKLMNMYNITDRGE